MDIASRRTAENLMEVMQEANVEERVSLEETLVKIMAKNPVTDQTLHIFWQQVEHNDFEKRLVPLRLIGIIARYAILFGI